MNRPGSALTRHKAKVSSTGMNVPVRNVENKIPQPDDYIKKRDWVGAITLLEYEKGVADTQIQTLLWLAYCYYHNGDYKKATVIYDELMRKPDYNKELHVYKACCLYALCNYDEARRECVKGTESPLYVRLMLHISHKKSDENSLMTYHYKIGDSVEDQLCMAAIHYLRGHFEEATEIYKKLLLENREYLAINVYIALCYYKMDYYDVSLEILNGYLSQNPTSIIAANLKACNQYQVFNGKAAEAELNQMQQYYDSGNLFNDYDLLRHNLVVFRGGQNALQVLPPLVEVFPEAKLNLVIYHLKNDEITEALNLVKDMEPNSPREYIIKGVVHAVVGQQLDSRDHLKQAQQYFQLVGASAGECDTIPGRQCMASCFFLMKQFEDVEVYLKSIKNFFQTDDDFNWNYGITLAANKKFQEAEEAFLLVQNEKYRQDYCYNSWLARCLIMNGKPGDAWDIYINMESSESFNLLQLIANDCYKMGHFYYAAKSFDILERLDSPDYEYGEAKRGAVVGNMILIEEKNLQFIVALGVFQMVVAKKETNEHLVEVLNMLKNSGNNPSVEYILKVVRKWGKDNGLKFQ